MTPILQLDGVVAGYGAGDVLKGVDLQVDVGTVACLIGPNGAGKSTVLRTISGLLIPSQGQVYFGDRAINHLSIRDRLQLGIVHVPQDRSLFPAMTVWDNLLLGGYLVRDAAAVRERLERAVEAFPICRARATDRAGSLSGGEQKQVELARVLMLDPTLVLLDEPSIGLDPKSRQIVFESIRTLSATGRTIVLVEQNARSGLTVADLGAVLESGLVRLVASGQSLLTDPEVARLYLGSTAGSRTVASTAPGPTANNPGKEPAS